MNKPLDFNTASRIKQQFKATGITAECELAKEASTETNLESPTTTGHFTYMVYRIERTKQGWEELKWSNLSEAQRLVWQRLANTLGLKMS